MSESNRRDFLKTVGAGGLALSAANEALAGKASKAGRVLGANDRINVAVIGYGGRGSYVAGQFAKYAAENNDACQHRRRLRCLGKAQARPAPSFTRSTATSITATCWPRKTWMPSSSPRPITGTAKSPSMPWTPARTSTWKSP